jgi:hypothetical protein
MDVSELFQLTCWIDREIKNEQISQRYQRLRDILNANTQPNRPKQPFENEKDDLIQALEKVPSESLSIQQLETLRKVGIGNHVGKSAVETVEDILFRNGLDIATAGQKFAEISNDVQRGVEWADSVRNALSDLVAEEPVLDGKILVRVTFSSEASIRNAVDLKTWSNIWHDIGRGVAMIHDCSPEQVEVVGASRGSIVLELGVPCQIAGTIAGIILAALKITETILNIRKKAAELKAMPLGNPKIVKDLDEEANNQKEKGVDTIVESVIKGKRKKETAEGDKVTALRKSVNNLVDFLEKGGAVDCVIPEDEPEVDTNEKTGNRNIRELRATFQEIRQLEITIKQLEYREEIHKDTAAG